MSRRPGRVGPQLVAGSLLLPPIYGAVDPSRIAGRDGRVSVAAEVAEEDRVAVEDSGRRHHWYGTSSRT